MSPATITFEQACELPAGPEREKKAESILRLVDQTIQVVRRISTDLRPGILDDLGLVAAVEWADRLPVAAVSIGMTSGSPTRRNRFMTKCRTAR